MSDPIEVVEAGIRANPDDAGELPWHAAHG